MFYVKVDLSKFTDQGDLEKLNMKSLLDVIMEARKYFTCICQVTAAKFASSILSGNTVFILYAHNKQRQFCSFPKSLQTQHF